MRASVTLRSAVSSYATSVTTNSTSRKKVVRATTFPSSSLKPLPSPTPRSSSLNVPLQLVDWVNPQAMTMNKEHRRPKTVSSTTHRQTSPTDILNMSVHNAIVGLVFEKLHREIKAAKNSISISGSPSRLHQIDDKQWAVKAVRDAITELSERLHNNNKRDRDDDISDVEIEHQLCALSIVDAESCADGMLPMIKCLRCAKTESSRS
eukprot:PhM_4_TR1704/c0_g1_i2/m.34404